MRITEKKIIIKAKQSLRGDDENKVISVRLRADLVTRLDEVAMEANRSRNEIIGLLLESAVSIVKIDGIEG